MFDGFTAKTIDTSNTRIYIRSAGTGAPLLLLHGFPQTHAMWHRLAPSLARKFTVICADLRGYGRSGKPPSGADHEAYSKRAMALDMIEIMVALGFESSLWSDTIAVLASPIAWRSTTGSQSCASLFSTSS